MTDIIKQQLNKLINDEQNIILAYSGGVDSSVLFHLLLENNYRFVIAHINHHSRPESEEEEKHAISLANKHNIPCEIGHFHHSKGNFQDQSRIYRLNFFREVAIKYQTNQVVLAHHANDNLETILFRLTRGGNLRSYGGLASSSTVGELELLRPMLNISKDTIREYALANNIIYFEDSSNASDKYHRNRIRHHVVPSLLNDGSIDCITRFSTTLKNASEAIRKVTSLLYKNPMPVSIFLSYDEIIQHDIIDYAFTECGLIPTLKWQEELIKLLESPKPNITRKINNQWNFIKCYDYWFLTNNKKVTTFTPVKIGLSDTIDIANIGRFYFSKEIPKVYTSFMKVCYNIECFPLTIRGRKPGDRLEVNNQHQKLKDFFINRKIPLGERDTFLVTKEDDILWVYDCYKRNCVEKNFIYLIYIKEELTDGRRTKQSPTKTAKK